MSQQVSLTATKTTTTASSPSVPGPFATPPVLKGGHMPLMPPPPPLSLFQTLGNGIKRHSMHPKREAPLKSDPLLFGCVNLKGTNQRPESPELERRVKPEVKSRPLLRKGKKKKTVAGVKDYDTEKEEESIFVFSGPRRNVCGETRPEFRQVIFFSEVLEIFITTKDKVAHRKLSGDLIP